MAMMDACEIAVRAWYNNPAGIRAAHFRLGWEDRFYGLERDHNPFDIDSPSKAALDWSRGWDANDPPTLPDAL